MKSLSSQVAINMNYSIFLVVLGASLLALVRPECSVEPQTKITGTHAPGILSILKENIKS